MADPEFDYWFMAPPEERDLLLEWCRARSYPAAFTWDRDMNFATIHFTCKYHAMHYQMVHYRRHLESWHLGFLCQSDPYLWFG